MARNYTPAQIADQAARSLELHAQGRTERDIADELGLSQSTVHRRLEHAIEAFVVPAGENAKALELARIDAVLASQATKLANGDSKAADVVLKAIALRAKLLGLEAPSKSETVVSEGPTPTLFAKFANTELAAIESYANVAG